MLLSARHGVPSVTEEPLEDEISASPVFFETERREAQAGPQLTPGETNTLATQTGVTVHTFEEREHQSEIPCRPSKHWIVFYLSPFGQWSAEDFLMGHEIIPRPLNRPRGRMSTQDERRNISIPPRVTYGSLVGESDGVAPYGLE